MTFEGDSNSNKADIATINANETIISGNLTASNVFLPKKTTTERDAMSAQDGMIIFNTTNSKAQVYGGGSWHNLW